jgi:hypothetical protein
VFKDVYRGSRGDGGLKECIDGQGECSRLGSQGTAYISKPLVTAQ